METYDVIAVDINTMEKRTLATDETETNADAIVSMAVARRGVETEFYKKVPHIGE